MSEPAYSKTIVCLAKSKKYNAFCVAGKTEKGEWIRPVGASLGGELSSTDISYSDRSAPNLLDVIEIQMKSQRNHSFQKENHLIDTGFFWSRKGALTWADARDCADECSDGIWDFGCPSSYSGKNDRVSDRLLQTPQQSLFLIHVKSMSAIARAEGAQFGDNALKCRGFFKHKDREYALSITDPTVIDLLVSKPNQQVSFGETLFCLSLAETYKGFGYKLIAGIMPRP